MKISINSWHYKMCKQIFDYPSNSLCVYFWQVPIAAIAIAFMAFILLSVACATVFVLSIPVIVNFVQMSYVGIILVGVASLVVWCALLKELNSNYRSASWNLVLTKPRNAERERAPKKPNLIVEYIKAKKSKVCPIIEFEGS